MKEQESHREIKIIGEIRLDSANRVIFSSSVYDTRREEGLKRNMNRNTFSGKKHRGGKPSWKR